MRALPAKDGHKVCRGCLEEKSVECFYLGKRGGIRPRCKRCMAVEAKAWRDKNPDAQRKIYRACNHRINLRRRFGITVEQFNALLTQYQSSHGNVCGICRESESRNRRLSLDHDHRTGMIRGFLCSRCNLLLGGAKDDPEILGRAARYLKAPPFQFLPGFRDDVSRPLGT